MNSNWPGGQHMPQLDGLRTLAVGAGGAEQDRANAWYRVSN